MWLCCEVPETFCGWKYFGSCLHKKTNWFLDAFEDEINGNCHKNSCVYAVSKQRFDKQHILYTFNSTIISLCWVGCRLMALSAQVGYIMPRQVNWYAVWGRINKYITLFNLLSPPLARDFLSLSSQSLGKYWQWNQNNYRHTQYEKITQNNATESKQPYRTSASEQGLTSPSTHYRSFRRWVFPVNRLHWYWQPNTNN